MNPRWIGLLVVVTAGVSRAQISPVTPLAFEVASIRQHVFSEQSRCSGSSTSGGRITLPCVSLRNLMMRAYDVQFYQIAGAPGVNLEVADIPYDVVAKAEGNDQLTQEQVNLMLQSLLANRFQLRLHREMKEVPAYALVVRKKGAKLTESASDAKNSLRFSIGGVKGKPGCF